jgi:hypothetical protein
MLFVLMLLLEVLLALALTFLVRVRVGSTNARFFALDAKARR